MTDNALRARRVIVPKSFLASPIYRVLRPNQRRIIDEMVNLYRSAGAGGAIRFSERYAAAACSIARETASKALSALETLGFIVCILRGESKQNGRASLWRLTMFAYNGEPATHEYLDLRRQEQFFKAKLRRRAGSTVVELRKVA
jgi:hypothetical protein